MIRVLSGPNWSSLISSKCEDIISREESHGAPHVDLQTGFWNADVSAAHVFFPQNSEHKA